MQINHTIYYLNIHFLVIYKTQEARDVMVNVMGNGLVDPSSNPGPCYSSHSANTIGKSMNPTTLPPAMGK